MVQEDTTSMTNKQLFEHTQNLKAEKLLDRIYMAKQTPKLDWDKIINNE